MFVFWYFMDDGAKITNFLQLLNDQELKWAQAALKANLIITYLEFLMKVPALRLLRIAVKPQTR